MESKSKIVVLGTDTLPSVVRLHEGESQKVVFVAPFGQNGTFDVTFELVGPGAELSLYGVYLCEGQQNVNFKINVRHLCAGSRSHQLFKGIVSGESSVKFEGLVYVDRGADQTEALQENHSLLLSELANVQSQPQLEIYADDVVCSHGATVGALDEQQLFYMCSRGISRELAQSLQIRSFLSPVLAQLPEELMERITKKTT